jgi:hypothetical protein
MCPASWLTNETLPGSDSAATSLACRVRLDGKLCRSRVADGFEPERENVGTLIVEVGRAFLIQNQVMSETGDHGTTAGGASSPYAHSVTTSRSWARVM